MEATTIAIIVALIAASPGLLNVLMSWGMRRKVNEVNDAVNNRHKRGDTRVPPKLYDLALEAHERTGRLEDSVDELTADFRALDQRVTTLDAKVEHLECYHCDGAEPA